MNNKGSALEHWCNITNLSIKSYPTMLLKTKNLELLVVTPRLKTSRGIGPICTFVEGYCWNGYSKMW